MISPNRRWLGGFVVVVALWPSLAPAQSMARSFEELQGILKAEEIVVVIDKTGQGTRGRVAEVSPSSLVLVLVEQAPGGLERTTNVKRTFAKDDVAEIVRSGRSETRTPIADAESGSDGARDRQERPANNGESRGPLRIVARDFHDVPDGFDSRA